MNLYHQKDRTGSPSKLNGNRCSDKCSIHDPFIRLFQNLSWWVWANGGTGSKFQEGEKELLPHTTPRQMLGNPKIEG